MAILSKGEFKKFLTALFIVAIIVGIFLYQNQSVRQYFERKTEQLLPADANQTTLYKWQDNKGRWQLTDTPPPPGTRYEAVSINHQTNVMPAEAFTGQKKP